MSNRFDHRRIGVGLLSGLMLWALTTVAAATAARLDGEDCEQLRSDQSKFLATGILDDIKQGPAAATKTLSPERLRDIEFFIKLEEQIKFGCRIYPLMNEVVSDEELARRAAAEGVALPIRRDVHFGTVRPRNDRESWRRDNGQTTPKQPSTNVRSTATQLPAATQLKGTVQPPDARPAAPEEAELPPWTTMGRNSVGGARTPSSEAKPAKTP